MKDDKALNYAIGNGTVRSALMKEDKLARIERYPGRHPHLAHEAALVPAHERAEELRRRLTPRRRRR
jgi:hypothetical protein